MNEADQHIADLIETLTLRFNRCSYSEDDKRQTIIDQIAQLRASMNPVIYTKKPKD